MSIRMWLVWKQPKTRRRYVVGSLTKNNNGYVFVYNKEFNEAQNDGFDFFPGFENTKEKYYNNELFTNIKSRLPNRSRPDYNDILKSYGLNEKSTDMEILERTRGRLFTDDFEFVKAFNGKFIEFDVAGTKYQNDLKKYKEKLKIGEDVYLKPEKENKYDKNAILIVYDKNMSYVIGYVPRYYNKYLIKLLKEEKKYQAKISNLNLEIRGDEMITISINMFE